MANKALRPCGEIGCTAVTRNTYCELHQKNIQQPKQNYNRYKRDPKADGFYKSGKWQRLRAVALARDNGLCQECKRQGTIRQAKVVHHLIEIKDEWERRYELSNLESLCHSCHNRIHKRYPRG